MEVASQRHVPAALYSGKTPGGWVRGRAGLGGGGKSRSRTSHFAQHQFFLYSIKYFVFVVETVFSVIFRS